MAFALCFPTCCSSKGDFDAVSLDPNFFPRYTPTIKDEAQEQTLRTIVDHVVNRHGDYRDLFTTPHTFLNKDLAALYAVPLVDASANGQPQRWLPYTYPAGDPRSGVLSQASFTTLFSPSGRTSPTVRGKALRQNILCEKVPPPPGNVSFKFVEDTSNPQFKTTRERVTAHRTEPMCAGCHKLTDPLGLALENFDSAGEFRTTENGVQIDASGELSGKQFVGAQGLAQAVHDDPAAVRLCGAEGVRVRDRLCAGKGRPAVAADSAEVCCEPLPGARAAARLRYCDEVICRTARPNRRCCRRPIIEQETGP